MTDSYFNPNGPQNKGAPQPLSPAEIPGTPPEVPHRPKEEEWKPYINEKAPLRSDDNVDLRSEPSAELCVPKNYGNNDFHCLPNTCCCYSNYGFTYEQYSRLH
ncbi:unnamed protein product [Cylicocyclus nassatus]|uniref:Uncharacterized protein n=1 Tax=Cylicocyclus nassatus TaxID=53992 RepID=A0AA36MF29_CYLNA|nr:unnamed protein product [Cylicocyclus nassatus]